MFFDFTCFPEFIKSEKHREFDKIREKIKIKVVQIIDERIRRYKENPEIQTDDFLDVYLKQYLSSKEDIPKDEIF
jgi:transcriptional regulator of met regulon